MKTRGEAWVLGVLTNPKSAHLHWAAQRKWAAGWRELTAYVCTGIVDAAPEVPKKIVLTAHVLRKFDRLNLQIVLSPIIDGLQAHGAWVLLRTASQRSANRAITARPRPVRVRTSGCAR